MKTLYLLRHAKSGWDDHRLGDFERPLNGRGQRAAQRMRRYIGARKLRPDLVLCSPARRTRATWDCIAPAIEPPPVFKALQSLYLASPSRLLAILRRLPADCGAVMLIGHNPGIAEGAEKLGGKRLPKYPTGALAAIRLDIARWRDLRAGRGRLVSFTTPAELE